MDYTVGIGLICILGIILGIYLVFSNKSKKQEEDFNQTIKIAEDIKDKLNKNKNSNLLQGRGVAKNGGGIINKNNLELNRSSISPEKNLWEEVSSYEDEVSAIEVKDDFNFTKENKNQEIINKINNVKQKSKNLILLVDDSLVIRKVVGDLLKNNNYEVILKNDGWEAITYLNSNSQKPDLIISDIEMPNMNGFQLIEAIRKDRKFNSVPILVISAHAESHIILMESESIQGFIGKPFEDNDLISQVKFLIDNPM